MNQKLISCFIIQFLTTTLSFVRFLMSSEPCDFKISMAFFQFSIEFLLIALTYSYISDQNESRISLNLANFQMDKSEMESLNWKYISFISVAVSFFSIITSTIFWLPLLQNRDEICTFLANYILLNFERFGFNHQSMTVQGLVKFGPDILQFGGPVGIFLMGMKNCWMLLKNVQTIVLVESGSNVFILNPVQNEPGYSGMQQITTNEANQRSIEN